jgi:hypothetical protein
MFDKYDTPAREKIKAALGDFIRDNPDQYKQDFVITEEDYKYKYIEIQVCASWTGDKFPYENVFVYERKGHYDEDTLFITLDRNMTHGYVFDAKSFKGSKPRRFKKYSREFVYDIPWNKIMPILVSKLTPNIIKLY